MDLPTVGIGQRAGLLIWIASQLSVPKRIFILAQIVPIPRTSWIANAIHEVYTTTRNLTQRLTLPAVGEMPGNDQLGRLHDDLARMARKDSSGNPKDSKDSETMEKLREVAEQVGESLQKMMERLSGKSQPGPSAS